MRAQYIVLVMAAYCGVASISGHVVLPVQKGLPLGACVRKLADWHKQFCALLNESEVAENLGINTMTSDDDPIWSFSRDKALANCCIRPCAYSELIYLC